jgi:hypothetical protein
MHIRRTRKKLNVLVMGSVLLLIAVLILSWRLWLSSSSPSIDETLKKQASFTVYYPSDNQTDVKVDDASTKFAMLEGEKVLNFVISIGNSKVTVSEQSYPDVLMYDKLASTFLNPSEINTSLGKVIVGRPKDAPQGQAAVMKTGDTLIFAKPSQDLSNQEWQLVFKALDRV